MTLAAQLADFVCATPSIPKRTRESAIRVICDLIAAAVAGYESPGGRAARTAARAAWGAGRSTCWFTNMPLTMPGAAFANSAIASMLDLDDGHRAAAGHPGASVIPAVFASADQDGADMERVLIAIALGYEIGVRIAAARDLKTLDTLATGRWCGPGAAAAVGWLRGLAPRQLAEAMAIASMTSPHLVPPVSGNNVKEGIPSATATGITAVELASAGFTGPLHFLDDEQRYNRTILMEGLGDRWMIDTIYFKPYSCCRWAHAAIDAVLQLQGEHGITSGAIQSIEVHTFSRALTLNNELAPSSLEAAQYSVPFCVALAAVRGADALLPLRESSLSDHHTLDLAQRITLHVDPELDAMFSRMVPARVLLSTDRGRHERPVIVAKGDPTNPMTQADLMKKFTTATRGLISSDCAASLSDALHALYQGNISPINRALRTPLDGYTCNDAAATPRPPFRAQIG